MGLARSKENRESFDRRQQQAHDHNAERSKRWKYAFFGLHWEKRLIAVCIYLIMSQWTTALVPYWYEETIEMTRTMLDGVLILTLLLPAVPWVRLLAGIFIVIWSVRAGGHAYEIWGSTASYEGIRISFSDYHPYIWLVGLIWCTYEIFNQTVRWTWHVMLLLVIQFIVFGALDSFTSDELWDQVAWLTGASLVWLIALHFSSINRRFPTMWRGSARYPIQMLISAVVLVSLIVTSGVSMPTVQPILQDPYTTWVNGGYGGIGGGTSQANTTSGYSRTDQDLGGGFNLDFSPVMDVTSDVRGYWRGESKYSYDGTGWKDSVSQLDETLPNEQLRLPMDTRPDESIPKRKIEQKIEMLNDEAYPVLFGMGMIASYDISSTEQQGTVRWGARDAELWYYSKPESYPKSYRIVSEVVILEPHLAAKSTKDGSTPEYGLDENWDPYLQLPDTVPARVKNLAYDITRDVDNDYERAVLIEEYLREKYFYTTKPDLSKKESEDFVDSFLFEIREGYCDYYSSSMAVMLRSLGVPTRWVKGYAPGTNTYMMDGGRPDQMNSPANDLGSATYRVTNADAHSWVEVWLDEYGWVAFEPTPGFNLPIISEDTAAEKEKAPEPEVKQEENKPVAEKEESEVSLPTWVGIAAQVIVMLSAAAALAYVLFRWSQVGFSLRWFRLLSNNLSMRERIILETEMWLSYCRMKGWRRAEGETVREMVARSFMHDDNRKVAAEQIVAAFEEAKYSGRELDEEDWQQLKNAVRRFKHPRSTVL
ncbi:transglutaminase TgpA family protein [Paenibacillus arenosi]|uniref:Transglutaminase domain-containing protein n=1 Tax=Paenibacillus arenosi TaxID=2774142 RepID=A0ABR9AZF4_9BACL|nr:transglutaminase domain-containing protein [Paenibacillus arenosi]MBD8499039.1 transglutaminase domain-containing protein [Paenibacillus arenosi]